MKVAFRGLGMLRKHFKYLVMKARSPLDGKNILFFFDKTLPFGSSISCSHFQHFSNAIAHILKYCMGKIPINYLDDYLMAALLKALCDGQINTFLDICKEINFLVNLDKTFWGMTKLTFLGLLIDTANQLVCIPIDKIDKAKMLINRVLTRQSKKLTIKVLQSICGFLNFIGRCIIPGRAFTRVCTHMELQKRV